MKLAKDMWFCFAVIVFLSVTIYLFGYSTQAVYFIDSSAEAMHDGFLWGLWIITALFFIILCCRAFSYFAAKKLSIAIGPIILILIAGACMGLNFSKHCFADEAIFTDHGLVFSAVVVDKYQDGDDSIVVIGEKDSDYQVQLYCTKREAALLQKGDTLGVIRFKYLKNNDQVAYLEYIGGSIERAGGFYEITD